ncbi:MAG: glycosyltransferase [Armatimonadota bacterium]
MNTLKKEKTKNNLRVLFGPIHIAGNFLGYSQGLSSLGVSSKIVLTKKHSFEYNDKNTEYLGNKIDLNKVNLKFDKGRIRGSFNLSNYKFLKFIDKFDIFHFTFGHSLLSENRDIPILKSKGKKIVMQFCGCDIRCRDIVTSENRKASPCTDCRIECITAQKRDTVKFWETHADAIISHPEYSQLLTKPYHYFIIGIDPDKWDEGKLQENSVPLIVHAPSMQDVKGTKYIVEAVNSLKNEGYDFEFKLLENMPNDELKTILQKADIVVDQLLCGWYGHLAVECMALGKPVLAYVDEKWCRQVGYAVEVPIINTTKDNIYENLKKLIKNPGLRKDCGRKSREYVEKVHDYRKVAKELLNIYSSI